MADDCVPRGSTHHRSGAQESIVLVLKKVLQWLDDRGYIVYTGDPSTYGSLGPAFLELQKIVEPKSQYVLEVKDEEEHRIEQDGEAGPDDPTRHFGKPE